MARLSPAQQQALAGAWFTIVGKGGHGGHGGHGRRSHGHHHHHHHQQQDGGDDGGGGDNAEYLEELEEMMAQQQDTSSGAWYDRRRKPWHRGYAPRMPYHYPYAAPPRMPYHYPYVPPYAPPYVPPHHHHHHHHHQQLDQYGYPYPVATPDYSDEGADESQDVAPPDASQDSSAADPAQQATPDQSTAAASGAFVGHYRGPGIPPRNALIQDPGPDRAGREVLPMSTGVAILPTQSAQITARPQRVAFRPERVFISAAGTSGGAADWVVNDIKIGNRSQFSQSGDVPGDMFATNAIDGFVSFETAQTAMDVVMVVTYIGLNESGVPFFASIVGTAAISVGHRSHCVRAARSGHARFDSSLERETKNERVPLMSKLTPYQQQALAGAWYTIVGRGGAGAAPHGGGGFHGGGLRGGFRGGGRPWRGYGGGWGWGGDYYGDLAAYDAAAYDAAYDDDGGDDVTPYPAAPPVAASGAFVGCHRGPGIPPRNALIQDPGPDRAGREVLPMSTGVAILPTQSAQITARPQRVAFRPERVFISAAGTSGGAADWVVNDIKIGNRSQFSQSGDVPGDMFATNAIDGFVSFETAQTAMDVVMVVTYIGLNESGVPFFASIVGTAAI